MERPMANEPMKSPGVEERRGSPDAVARFLGGSPLGVLARLILLSILVGVLLSAFGLDPWNIVRSVQTLVRRIWEMGFEAVEWVWRYFLLGAVLVVPIWLIIRLAKAPRGG
jgi:hypothetical protein